MSKKLLFALLGVGAVAGIAYAAKSSSSDVVTEENKTPAPGSGASNRPGGRDSDIKEVLAFLTSVNFSSSETAKVKHALGKMSDDEVTDFAAFMRGVKAGNDFQSNEFDNFVLRRAKAITAKYAIFLQYDFPATDAPIDDVDLQKVKDSVSKNVPKDVAKTAAKAAAPSTPGKPTKADLTDAQKLTLRRNELIKAFKASTSLSKDAKNRAVIAVGQKMTAHEVNTVYVYYFAHILPKKKIDQVKDAWLVKDMNVISKKYNLFS